uniref:Putative secreted protein n=1 Tax=Anopheles darlingi TaxID=43151 RepID=A0A2M4DB68_ANODA
MVAAFCLLNVIFASFRIASLRVITCTALSPPELRSSPWCTLLHKAPLELPRWSMMGPVRFVDASGNHIREGKRTIE